MLNADPYAQLRLAHQITTNAFSQQAKGLEGEISQLRQNVFAERIKVQEAQGQIAQLQNDLAQEQEKVRVRP